MENCLVPADYRSREHLFDLGEPWANGAMFLPLKMSRGEQWQWRTSVDVGGGLCQFFPRFIFLKKNSFEVPEYLLGANSGASSIYPLRWNICEPSRPFHWLLCLFYKLFTHRSHIVLCVLRTGPGFETMAQALRICQWLQHVLQYEKTRL